MLEKVYIKIPAGRMIGIVGDNGQGKTTILRMMAGISHSSGGQIIRYTDKISYVLSATDFYSWMKVKDALLFYESYYERFDYRKAVSLLGESGISLDNRIQRLSKGQQERLCLILAISQEAELYLMDEPLSGIDPHLNPGQINHRICCGNCYIFYRFY